MKILPSIAATFALAAAPLHAQAPEEVPFVVTPDNVTLAMLEAARVGPRDYVIDLGSGDGRIVIAAAKRFGARGLGVDNDPGLVQLSRENARKAGVADRAEFREQDLFITDLKPATVVTLYLLPAVNLQLRPTLLGLAPGTRIVSHDWDMGEWQADRKMTIPAPEKKLGLAKSSTVHYWVVPAKIEGTWCGVGKAEGARFEFAQAFQQFRGFGNHGKSTQPVEGRIEGRIVRTTGDEAHALVMEHQDELLKVASSRGRWASFDGATFRRASGRNTC
jgi:SAM-dependent methyltransferase